LAFYFLIQVPAIDLSDSNCGVTKGCFHDCSNSNCNFVVSWRDVGNDVEFEITSRVTAGTDKWIAIGFSSDKSMVEKNILISTYNVTI